MLGASSTCRRRSRRAASCLGHDRPRAEREGCATPSTRLSATAPASCSPCSARWRASPGSSKSSSATSPARAGVIRGRCLSYGEGITYWPLREAVKSASGSRTPTLTRWSRSSPPRLWRRGRPHRPPGCRGDRPRSGARRRRALRGAGAVRGVGQPAAPVVVFEDIHWGEPAFSSSWSTSRTGRGMRRSCSSALPGPSCSNFDPVGATERHIDSVGGSVRGGKRSADRQPGR